MEILIQLNLIIQRVQYKKTSTFPYSHPYSLFKLNFRLDGEIDQLAAFMSRIIFRKFNYVL